MTTRDAADGLTLFELEENPSNWEAAMCAEQERAKTDASARAVLESIYCEQDRGRAFQRFYESFELGGGPGWLGWALHLHGYRSLEMLEPNGCFTTGTGYLRTREDAQDIRIWNDLPAWYASPERYDAVLTHNCAHHFRNLSYVAACIRQKIRPGGRWLMIREPYVDTPGELYELLRAHPYCQKYGAFEYAAPASHYVEALELAGFALAAVVPAGYANDTLSCYSETPGGPRNQLVTAAVDLAVAHAPAVTTALYRAERLVAPALKLRPRFSRPQAMLFERVEITAG
jgi:alkylhydroperoxidase family enzyme